MLDKTDRGIAGQGASVSSGEQIGSVAGEDAGADAPAPLVHTSSGYVIASSLTSVITPDDPTALTNVGGPWFGGSYWGDGYWFDLEFEGLGTRSMWVREGLGDADAALAIATRLGTSIGQMPLVLLNDLGTISVHGNVGNGIGATAAWWNGDLNIYNSVSGSAREETIIHEFGHLTMEKILQTWSGAQDAWRAAQNADRIFISQYAEDFPAREDIAESLMMYIAVRVYPDRVGAERAADLEETFKHRFDFFDTLGLDYSTAGRDVSLKANNNYITVADTEISGAWDGDINILRNDYGFTRKDLKVVAVNGVEFTDEGTAVIDGSGSLRVNSDGRIDFDAASDFDGITPGDSRKVTFSYTVEDNAGNRDTANVVLKVENPAEPQPAGATESFEDGASHWTNNITSTANGNAYLGGFGGGERVEKSYSIDPDASTAIVTFDFLEIDSWDNEDFVISVNGQDFTLGRFSWQAYEGATSFSNGNISVSKEAAVYIHQYGNTSDGVWYNDENLHRVTLEVQNPGEVITLGFAAELNGAVSDESWGIDNLTVTSVVPQPELAGGTETFEDGATNWSGKRTSTGDGNGYLGGFGAGETSQKTYILDQGATSATITLDFLEIDSWDDEDFLISVNGQEFSLGTFSWQIYEGATSFTTGDISVSKEAAVYIHQYGNTSDGVWFNDENMHRVTLDVQNPGETITLGFAAELNGSASDESWGIDNLTVTSVLLPVVPVISISADTASVQEGAEGASTAMTFTVSLSEPTTVAITADVTIDGAATGPASVTIPAGTASVPVSLSIAGDNVFEADEAITVTLNNIAGATAGTLAATQTVLNDDALVPVISITADTASVQEGAEGASTAMTFTVSLSEPTTVAITADVTIDGAATGPASVTIPAGATSVPLSLNIAGDDTDNPDETITVRLGSINGATAGTVSASAQVLDDDEPAVEPEPTPSVIEIEAEAIIASGFRTEAVSIETTNGQVASLLNAGTRSGVLSYEYDGAAAVFDLSVIAFDETDGNSRIDILVNGTSVQTAVLNQSPGGAGPETRNQVSVDVAGLTLRDGDVIEVQGASNRGEWVRIDKLVLTDTDAEPEPSDDGANGSSNDQTQQTPPTNEFVFGTSTYELGTAGLSWTAAQSEAEARGGKIVTIDSAEENQFIFETFGTGSPVWLGLTDTTAEGSFVDTDGDAAAYTNWLPGEPSFGRGQDYAAMSSSTGQWDDTSNAGGWYYDGVWSGGYANVLVIEYA